MHCQQSHARDSRVEAIDLLAAYGLVALFAETLVEPPGDGGFPLAEEGGDVAGPESVPREAERDEINSFVEARSSSQCDNAVRGTHRSDGELLELLDQGRDASGRGDDVGGDGIFTGVYKNTAQNGPYNFLIRADIEGWHLAHDAHEYRADTSESPRFEREVRLTASVGDPKGPVGEPEDGPPGVSRDEPLSRCCRIIVVLLFAALLLLLLIILMIWRCCCSKRLKG
jgi:hypothetical protein